MQALWHNKSVHVFPQKTTHHVWEGVEKKALPLTCASQSAQPRKCWTNKGETVRQARTMRGNPHVPLYAGTRSWAAEPERLKRHQPGKTQPGARDHDHESEEKSEKWAKSRNYCYQARITPPQKMTATVGSVNEQLPCCDAAGRHEPEKNELPPPTLGGEGRNKLHGSSPDWAATAWATCFSKIMASASQAPVLSATMGIKQTPCARHASAL